MFRASVVVLRTQRRCEASDVALVLDRRGAKRGRYSRSPASGGDTRAR